MDKTTEYSDITYDDFPKEDITPIHTHWKHEDRYTFQEIINGIFLGSLMCVSKQQEQKLKAVGITHLVCVRTDSEENFTQPKLTLNFEYLSVNLQHKTVDDILPNLIHEGPKFKDFINHCLKMQGKCLVYCVTGCDVSALILACYLVETFGMTESEAFKHIQARRLCVTVVQRARQVLTQYAELIHAKKQISSVARQQPSNSKRKLVEVDPDSDQEKMETC